MAVLHKDQESRRRLVEKRNNTLYQITALIIAVFVLAGLASSFIYRRSQDRLIESSKDKLIQMQVDNVCANSSFVIDYLILLGENKLRGMDAASLAAAAETGGRTVGQQYLDDRLANMVDARFMGIEAAAIFTLPSGDDPRTTIVAASEEGLVYAAQVPGAVEEAIEEGVPYIWTEGGVPELGVAGTSLVVAKKVSLNGSLEAGYVVVKPMAAEVAAAGEFFQGKRELYYQNLAAMITISVAAMSLLTLAFIVFLVRRRITRPIDELSDAAGKVIAGDLEVEARVCKGDEFEGLERAFNTMVKSLNAIISRSQPERGEGKGRGDDAPGHGRRRERGAGAGKAVSRFKPARSRTLLYITLFLVVMFLASGLADFLIFDHWQGDLVGDARDELVRGISGYFINASNYIRSTLDPVITERMQEAGIQDFGIMEQYALMLEGKTSKYQDFYIQFCEQLVDLGALGMEKIMVVLAGSLIPDGATVVVADEREKVYNWPIPPYLLEAMENGDPYIYFADGIPELDLQGEYIITIETFEFEDMLQGYIGARSMHAEITELRGFSDRERRSIHLTLMPVMGGALIALILITFLVMRFLIHRNITGPVDELCVAVEQVMAGDLEVEIPVREGEELEGLKVALREMVESFRFLVERSTQ